MSGRASAAPRGAGGTARDQEPKANDPVRRTPLEREPLELSSPNMVASAMLVTLRELMPYRALAWREAEVLAERQADRLRSALGVLGPVLNETDLATLPWLTISRSYTLPISGAATSTEFGWLIALKADDAMVRQRFSLAHEVKHVLDDELMASLPDGLYPATRGYSAHQRTERMCDRFAGALLMPRVLLRADWADGLQDIAKLAKRYDVSRAAMRVRLRQLGLLEPMPRCQRPNRHEGANQ
jgi:hypothetical protein